MRAVQRSGSALKCRSKKKFGCGSVLALSSFTCFNYMHVIKLKIYDFLSLSNQYQGPDLAQYGVSVYRLL